MPGSWIVVSEIDSLLLIVIGLLCLLPGYCNCHCTLCIHIESYTGTLAI